MCLSFHLALASYIYMYILLGNPQSATHKLLVRNTRGRISISHRTPHLTQYGKSVELTLHS